MDKGIGGVIALAVGAMVVAVIALGLGEWVKPVDQVSDAVRSVDKVQCLNTLPTVTPGNDPRTNRDFKSCTDGNIIVTIYEDKDPVGFNQTEGRELTPSEVAGYIK